MKHVLILIFICVHLFAGNELGYSIDSSLLTHFTYQFQHLNWMHLGLNSIALISFCRILQKVYFEYIVLIYAYLISIVVSFFSEYHLPTVGSSAMIYAMIGLFLSISIIGKKLHIVNQRKFTLLIIGIMISFVISYYKNSANNACHLYALLVGIITGICDYIFNKA